MYSEYFDDWQVRPEFKKEFISLWPGWLGEENLHKLNSVTEADWSKFNKLIKLIASKYRLVKVNAKASSTEEIENLEKVLNSYEEAMNKESDDFSKFILPELECVLSENWDYTYILWHKNSESVNALSPFVKEAGLKHFNE